MLKASAVERPQPELAYLQCKVHVAGSVNDVDEVIVPGAGGGSAGDGDAALLQPDVMEW